MEEKPKRSIKEESDLAGLLSYIENNTAKENFIAWLNTQQNKSYSEEDSWEHIKVDLQGTDGVNIGELRTYAKTLGAEQDTNKLLQEVKKSTEDAEKTVQKLSYLSYFKKFSVAVGGACVFVGILFFIFSLSLFFHFIGQDEFSEDLETIIASVSLFVGLINILSGLLLATR